jgi:hypothetical protein
MRDNRCVAVAACARCGARLGGWFPAGTMCDECTRGELDARLRRSAELAEPRECPECGELFMALQGSQRFCSSACRVKAWRRERRAVVTS